MMCCEGCLTVHKDHLTERRTHAQAEEGRPGGGSGQCLPNSVTQSVAQIILGCVCCVYVGVMSYFHYQH